MSRLTKKQSIDYYGRNLPTPTIEKITINDLKDNDAIYESVDKYAGRGFGGTGEEIVTRDDVRNTMSRLDVDVSFYFSTWEGFDVDGVGDDLFSTLTSAIQSDSGIYITLFLSFGASLAATAGTQIKKPHIIDQIDRGAAAAAGNLAKYPGTADYNDFTISYLAYKPTSTQYVISLPLSEFFEVSELTAEQDIDGNPVIKFTNIKITTYIKNLKEKNDVRVFCCTSTAHPYEIKMNAGPAMDPLTLSINYSDVTYEDVMRNGALATFGEPVFIDGAGLHYPQQPLRGLNTLYYKTTDFGSHEIIQSVNALISEYASRIPYDEELEDVTDQTKFVMQTYEDDIELLVNLNKISQGFSITNEDSKAIIFTQRIRILINNIDAMLRRQEQVVRRIYRNFKIIDARTIVVDDDVSVSYEAYLRDKDFLYQKVFNTNIAKYVPMATAGSTYPGKSELPATPAQRAEEFYNEMTSIRKQLANLMHPEARYGGFSITGITEAPLQYIPTTFENLLENLARQAVAQKIDNVVDEMTTWAFEGWAGRFIKGSSHPAYNESDNHSGAHYWMSSGTPGAPDYHNPLRYNRNPGVSSGGVSDANGTVNRRFWDDGDFAVPQRFLNLVYHASGLGQAPRSHLVDDDFQGGLEGSSPPIHAFTENIDTATLNPDHWGDGGPERVTGGDPEATIRIFGYDPRSLDLRPDTTPPYQHAALMDYHNHYVGFETDRANSSTWPKQAYIDPYFWSTTKYRQLWAMYTLAQQDHQIEVLVPKRTFPQTSSPALPGQTVEIDPEDYISSDLSLGPRLSSGITGQLLIQYGYDNSEFQGAQGEAYSELLQYREDFYEKVGGFSCLYKNSISTENEKRVHAMDALSLKQQVGIENEYGFTNIGWWRCVRRKRADIRERVKRVVYTVYGIDPDSELSTAGAGAYTSTGMIELTDSDAGDTFTDGMPDAVPVDASYTPGTESEQSSTNPFTTLDSYIAEGPARIAEAAISEVLGEIDAMSSESAQDFNTPNERDYWADKFADKMVQIARSEISDYYNVKLCKIYATTCLPESPIRRQKGIKMQSAVSPGFQYLDYRMAVGRNRGSDAFPAILYGYWDLDDTIVRQSIEDSEAGLAYYTGGSGKIQWTYDYFEYNFAQDFKDIMNQYIGANRDRIRDVLHAYITRRALYMGYESDTGIHSALGEIDIVLNKYGYFFFDMEKYIRRNSYLSKVLNVDRFLTNFPTARQITNSACRLKRVSVGLDNFANHPDGIDRGGYSGTKNMARVELIKDEETATAVASPHDFKLLRFTTPLNDVTGIPYVYRKVDALQAIDFSEIIEYTVGYVGPTLEEATPGGGGMGDDGTDSATGDTGYTGTTGGDGDTDGDSGVVGTTGGTVGTGPALPEFGIGIGTMPLDMPTFEASGQNAADALRAASVEIRGLQSESVDIAGLTSDARYAPIESNTYLVMRSYAFPGFQDAALLGGHRWRKNYRLYMFKYQFLMDDDLAYSYSGDGEFDDGINSYDNLRFAVRITDESKEVFYAMVEKYREAYNFFIREYFNYAEEACAYDAFSQGFNNFFKDSMLHTFPEPKTSPWLRMITMYTMYANIMTEKYKGDRLLMLEDASNILQLIRPETGNLLSLRNFKEAAESMEQMLISKSRFLRQDVPLTPDGVPGDTITEKSFTWATIVGAPVIDHIGDYTTEETVPGISEFGGFEYLYEDEDF